ncbi:malto-oligosyltrehalose trehalohydrolase [Candidatus Viridilinea mediisalina]|uniref:Malto-oligosyltrehalose trehalohydrolase n=1 Tax=Candidatus Viridilinea mediisalina TaxID=2024553 RepID=A0A2A6RF74_9CHLR|nr:malto-oligosyltrehalose trehalohydrolase [Candidatus Viridilinea mediisalina]PDW01528.1 malto-oligosyltrehalose trehalohydrolase [Candidatus Viridilinea mediisalina]
MAWKLPIGAQSEAEGTHFRVWAPRADRVEVLLPDSGAMHSLTSEEGGYFAGYVAGVGVGTHYAYCINGGAARPDPASRSQPEGVHGPSAVVDPTTFAWSDSAWRGVALEDLVIYELHVGTATPAGTFDALIERLDSIKALGVTAIELMPVADFPGERNWGYDGVNLYAPARTYGGAEGLRRLVDAAHAKGLAVLLDVVYNHFGPDGNYLREFSLDYFTDRHTTPWGDAINVDGPEARPVRDFFINNALYWLHEYHVDGLRLDAVHAIIDDSATHVIAELAAAVRAQLPAERHFLLIAEHEANDPALVRGVDAKPQAGWGLDGVWADDFHHQVRVALTGEQEGYYGDYSGSAQDLAATIRQNWFFQGQRSPHLGHTRGAPASDVAPAHFVYCIQNHDQVGNRAFGERLHHTVTLEAYRAASTLLLLAPQTPLLWMGQEWAAATPFLFFTDHNPELGKLVTEGRRREFASFTAFSGATVPDPQDVQTFLRSKLQWEEREHGAHAGILALYRDLLALRRSHVALRERTSVSVKPVDDRTITLHYRSTQGAELFLAVSLGGVAEVELEEKDWQLHLDSEAVSYGGHGVPSLEEQRMRFTGARAVVLVRG